MTLLTSPIRQPPERNAANVASVVAGTAASCRAGRRQPEIAGAGDLPVGGIAADPPRDRPQRLVEITEGADEALAGGGGERVVEGGGVHAQLRPERLRLADRAGHERVEQVEEHGPRHATSSTSKPSSFSRYAAPSSHPQDRTARPRSGTHSST